MPNLTVYKCYPSAGKGTINTGTTLNVNFGTLRAGTSITITNFDESSVFEVQLNSTANDSISVPPAQSLIFNDEYITSIFITNSAGSAIEYQVVVLGG